MQPCSGDLPRGSSQSHAPITSLHRMFSRLTGRSKSSRKKEIKFFSKIQVFRFLTTQFGNLFASGSSSHEVYSKLFVAPFATSLRVDLLLAKNTQTNFSNFVSGVFGDLFATHFSRENRVLCALRTVFKNFSIFSSLTFTVHCLVRSSLSQTHRVSLKNPSFSSSSLLQTSRKGMGFLFFSKYFMFIAFDSLVFELLLRFEKHDVRIWVRFILLSVLNGICCF